MDLHNSTTIPTTEPNPDPTSSPNQAEAERLLGIAEKLLHSRDLTGSREFALLAQESEPLLEGSDQILAIADTLIASEKRVNNNRHHDWYAILQTDRRATSSEPDLLKRNYRRLALLLHPDKNKYPLADSAFKLVGDAWAVLSDPSKRTPYDHELSLFSKVDLCHNAQVDKDKLPVRRSPRGGVGGVGGGGADDVDDENYYNSNAPTTTTPTTPAGMMNDSRNVHHSRAGVRDKDRDRVSNFWTACPYCYVLYEYPKVYKECCLRCQNCERAFHAAPIPSLPPIVPGKEAYYCCWGFFPLGFTLDNKKGGAANKERGCNKNNANNVTTAANNGNNMGFPNWMPGMFTAAQQGGNANMNVGGTTVVDFSDGSVSAGFGNAMRLRMSGSAPGAKKRGRPRKNPLGA